MIAFVLLAVLAYWLFVSRVYLPDSKATDPKEAAEQNAGVFSQRGQFGDTFGGINALFSGLAFAVIISSLRLQRLTMEQQNRSLALQSRQIEESQRALAEQTRIATEANVLQALAAQLEYDRHTIEAALGGQSTPPTEAIRELMARQPALIRDVEKLTDRLRSELKLERMS